ncbi:MAG: sensor histidine kinase [Syntrophales bacterium]
MKKKIIFGLAIFALMFFFGGIYIVKTTETTIFDLHRLSQMHHTVELRKDLLLIIKKNQNSIILWSMHSPVAESSGDNRLMGTVKKCTNCHHSASAQETIIQVQKQVEIYHRLIREMFTARPGSIISEGKVKAALQLGDDLIEKIERIIAVTTMNLDRQEREILGQIEQRKITLFMLVTIGPFFAVGLAFFLINGLTRPVNSLLDATRRLKAGDLDHRIRGLYDEFGEVAGSFNEMAASLKKQMQEMQRTEQLRVCGEMAAGLAHEIRNPLAGMKVSIEVLLAELNLQERDREVLMKVIEQIRNIELLIKNLLNYARPVAAQPVSFNINRILEKSVYFIEKHPAFLSGDPPKKMIRELDESLPEIIGDPQQLQQVFLNLLLNAADAIADGGEIMVKTRQNEKGRSVAIEVHNTGQGIPHEVMEKIFQPFFTTKGKGTGLGLAVSKRIVEEHRGTITVANGINGGVTVTIILPVTAGRSGEAI